MANWCMSLRCTVPTIRSRSAGDGADRDRPGSRPSRSARRPAGCACPAPPVSGVAGGAVGWLLGLAPATAEASRAGGRSAAGACANGSSACSRSFGRVKAGAPLPLARSRTTGREGLLASPDAGSVPMVGRAALARSPPSPARTTGRLGAPAGRSGGVLRGAGASPVIAWRVASGGTSGSTRAVDAGIPAAHTGWCGAAAVTAGGAPDWRGPALSCDPGRPPLAGPGSPAGPPRAALAGVADVLGMGAWVTNAAVFAGRSLTALGRAAAASAGSVPAAGGTAACAAGERCTSPRTVGRDGAGTGAGGRGDTGGAAAAPDAGVGFARAAGRAVPSPMT